MELVTGYGGKAHITPENWADLNRGFSGMESYVTETGRKFEAELISNNLLKIHDGCGIMQGRQVVILKGQSDEVTIQNGTQGMTRIDLVVERYTKNPDTKIETTETVLIKGTPSTNPTVPAYTVGDIRSGDMKADWPLYEVELNGINVVEVRPVFKTLVNMSEIQEMLTELNSKIDGNITAAQNSVNIMGDSYVKKVGNKVSLQIVAQSSSALASGTKYHIADIPAEFRPKRRELTAAFANSSSTTGYGVAYMDVDVTGAINAQFATQAKNLFGHLEYFL